MACFIKFYVNIQIQYLNVLDIYFKKDIHYNDTIEWYVLFKC